MSYPSDLGWFLFFHCCCGWNVHSWELWNSQPGYAGCEETPLHSNTSAGFAGIYHGRVGWAFPTIGLGEPHPAASSRFLTSLPGAALKPLFSSSESTGVNPTALQTLPAGAIAVTQDSLFSAWELLSDKAVVGWAVWSPADLPVPSDAFLHSILCISLQISTQLLASCLVLEISSFAGWKHLIFSFTFPKTSYRMGKSSSLAQRRHSFFKSVKQMLSSFPYNDRDCLCFPWQPVAGAGISLPEALCMNERWWMRFSMVLLNLWSNDYLNIQSC